MCVTANYIEVEGRSRFKNKLAEHVAHYCLKELLPRYKTITVWMNIGPLDGDEGYCLEVENKTFEIEISDELPMKEFISTICHEMVHVKQHVKRELVATRTGRQLWKGRDHSKTNYEDQPWEKEAYELQDVLCLGFLDHSKFTSLRKYLT